MGWYIETAVKIVPPTATELAYLAGLLDGEGCYFAQNNMAGLKVAMTDPAPIEWLGEHFAGTIHQPTLRKPWRQVYVWNLQRVADLMYLLPLLRPWIKVRPERLEALYLLCEHRSVKPPRGSKDLGFPEWKHVRDELSAAVRAASAARSDREAA